MQTVIQELILSGTAPRLTNELLQALYVVAVGDRTVAQTAVHWALLAQRNGCYSLPPDQRRQQFAMQQQVVLVQSISLYLISYCLRARAFDCIVLLIIPAVLSQRRRTETGESERRVFSGRRAETVSGLATTFRDKAQPQAATQVVAATPRPSAAGERVWQEPGAFEYNLQCAHRNWR